MIFCASDDFWGIIYSECEVFWVGGTLFWVGGSGWGWVGVSGGGCTVWWCPLHI